MRLTPFLVAAGLALVALVSPASGRAQEAGGEEIRVQHEFGERISFTAQFDLDQPIESGQVYMQVEGEAETRVAQATLLAPNRLMLNYSLEDRPVRAFSEIEYWFELALEDGSAYETNHNTFYYEDNRFDWQERQQANFRVHWYDGDAAFGQSLLDVAIISREKILTVLTLETPEVVDVYAYASGVDMREALQLAGMNWVGAHTDPDLSTMVLSLPPGADQRYEMERQIPHELMHIMLYAQWGNAYVHLPIWLNEGLGSIAELYPNPDYLVVLENATERDALLPMATLCDQFPRDASGAYLAYAEAESFTRYLYRQYGSNSLGELVATYADGVECERAISLTYGSTLTQMAREWQRESLNADPVVQAALNLSPWITLSVVLVVVPLAVAAVLWRRL